MNKKVFVIFGTRPEYIKLFPLVLVFREQKEIDTIFIHTGQHTDMLDDTIFNIGVSPDIVLDAISHSTEGANRSLSYMLEELNKLVKEHKPSMIVVQGDTTSALAGALSSMTFDVPLTHVEAGLRTYNKNPFPEEANRQIISRIASINCCPTINASYNLMDEEISGEIFVTGNTEIDALYYALDGCSPKIHYGSDGTKRQIMVTLHRRENIGAPIRNVCKDLIDLAESFELDILVTRHKNPSVAQIINEELGNIEIGFNSDITVIEPMDYISFIYQLMKANIIITDSGGIQESASALGIPVIVAREETDRPEGKGIVCGTDQGAIYSATYSLLKSSEEYDIIAKSPCPFGDGRAATKIKDIVMEALCV